MKPVGNDDFEAIQHLVWLSAWVATNERHYGEWHHETSTTKLKLKACKDACPISQDFADFVLHTSWAIIWEIENYHRESQASAERARRTIEKRNLTEPVLPRVQMPA